MTPSCKRAAIALLWLWLAGPVVGAALPTGWRGNWTGRFPDASPPRRWRQVSTLMAGLRCSAARPKGDGPEGAPAYCGAVTEWLILGPIPAPKDGQAPDPATLRPQAGGSFGGGAWTPHRTQANLVDLAALFGPEARGAAYAHAYIWAPHDAKVSLRFRSHGPFEVYLNGQPLDPKRMPAYADLRRGWNRLLCRTDWMAQKGEYHVHPSLWHFAVAIAALPPCDAVSENILWRCRLPNRSIANPIVVGDRIYLVSEPHDLVCVRKSDGRILWMRPTSLFDTVPEAQRRANPAFAAIGPKADRLKAINDSFADAWPPDAALAEKKKLEKEIRTAMRAADPKAYRRRWSELHGSCVPVPYSDGKAIYIWLAHGVGARYDLDGNRAWTTVENIPIKHHGFTTSPVVLDGKLIVYMRKLFAFDAGTGRRVWSMDIATDDSLYGDHFHESLLAIRIGGQDLIYAHGQIIRPSDGALLWKGPQLRLKGSIPTTIVADGVLYDLSVSGSLRTATLPASADPLRLAPKRQIDIYRGPDAYTRTFFAASPLYHDGLLYCIDCMSNLFVIDARIGQLVYRRNLCLGPEFRTSVHIFGTAYASPILMGDAILAVGMTGTMVVFAPGRTYRELERNRIENVTNPRKWYERVEGFPASPICDGDRIYLRGDEYLYCIGTK